MGNIDLYYNICVFLAAVLVLNIEWNGINTLARNAFKITCKISAYFLISYSGLMIFKHFDIL